MTALAYWWGRNGRYLLAWACHAAAMALFRPAARLAMLRLPAPAATGFPEALRDPAAVGCVLALLVANAALSLAVFRLAVMHVVVRREPWAAEVERHPWRPYVVGWMGYLVLNLAALFATGLLLWQALKAIPQILWAIRVALSFVFFRMSVRKFVLPRACGVHGGGQ